LQEIKKYYKTYCGITKIFNIICYLFIEMKKIILDTNFLMIPSQFKVDIFTEINRICHFNYKLYIYEKSLDELSRIMLKGGKDKKNAKLAMDIVKLKKIEVIKKEGKDVDSLILENADKDTIVATQDIRLKKELVKKGVSVIILRKKEFLIYFERKAL
jgi:rRNA-processing protein FCF1